MRARIQPGGIGGGVALVPGDKSIAHRWLILSATARGRSALRNLPVALDVRSTASCLALLADRAAPSLEGWMRNAGSRPEGGSFTSNMTDPPWPRPEVVVEAEGRRALREPEGPLDCGNSGTSIRLLAGVVASASFRTVLEGDASLSARPMERVAEPLRRMGADVRTIAGHPPLVVRGADLIGIRHRTTVPSAQVKSAVLLAGADASGETTVEEGSPTRDHMERALRALGAPVRSEPGVVTVSAYQHEGFSGAVPGDASSAAFLLAAAALAGVELEIDDVGLNPSRLHFLDVMGRMGVPTEAAVEREELGEPVGRLSVLHADGLKGTSVGGAELPLVIDEVPVLAALAAHADGESGFLQAGELRAKESDRLEMIARGIRGLGGDAGVQGDDLVVAGGGLAGGRAEAASDHRIAMALSVAALAARGPGVVDGIEWAEVSFPGFIASLKALGADVEVET